MISLNSFIINLILFSSYVCIIYNIGKYLISISSWDFIMSGDVPIMCSIAVLTAVPFMKYIVHAMPKPIDINNANANTDNIDNIDNINTIHIIDWEYLATSPVFWRYYHMLQNKCSQLK